MIDPTTPNIAAVRATGATIVPPHASRLAAEIMSLALTLSDAHHTMLTGNPSDHQRHKRYNDAVTALRFAVTAALVPPHASRLAEGDRPSVDDVMWEAGSYATAYAWHRAKPNDENRRETAIRCKVALRAAVEKMARLAALVAPSGDPGAAGEPDASHMVRTP